jgi:radical SAM protein with 4Fe4S-binding SPASM domain
VAKMTLRQAAAKLPALLLRGRMRFDFDGIPQEATGLSWKRRWNLLRVGLDTARGATRLRGLPPIIQVEPTNACNLRCPLCPTGSDTLVRSRANLPLETFVGMLDEIGDTLVAVYLFCFGEPLIHRDFVHMVEACESRGILTMTTTNGHYIRTEEEALALVDAGLRMIIFAIDGSTQEVYGAYRRGGDLEKAKRGARLLAEARAKRGTKHPYLALRTVVHRENEADLPNLERMARDLGMDMFTYKSLGCLSHSEEYESFAPEGEAHRRFEYEGDVRVRRETFRCIFPFRQPIVFADGTLVGCEYDHEASFAYGRIGEQPFRAMWNGENAVSLRKRIRGEEQRAAFCEGCPYQDRVQGGSELVCVELG